MRYLIITEDSEVYGTNNLPEGSEESVDQSDITIIDTLKDLELCSGGAWLPINSWDDYLSEL